MSNYSDFTEGQNYETESFMAAAPAYDFCEHALQQNKRDDDSRVEYHAPKERLQAISYRETCERCRKDLAHVYLWNGKRLCRSCMEEGQETWVLFTGSPNAAAQRVSMQPLSKAKAHSRMDLLISEFLALFGLKRIEKESVSEPKMPIKRAKLLAAKVPDKKQMPKAEGIMNSKKRKNS